MPLEQNAFLKVQDKQNGATTPMWSVLEKLSECLRVKSVQL